MCGFCNMNNDDRFILGSPLRIFSEVFVPGLGIVKNNKINVAINNCDLIEQTIKFCPMCGEELERKE